MVKLYVTAGNVKIKGPFDCLQSTFVSNLLTTCHFVWFFWKNAGITSYTKTQFFLKAECK